MIEVHLGSSNYPGDALRIYISDKNEFTGERFLWQIKGPREIFACPIKPGEDADPTLVLVGEQAVGFLKAMAEAAAKHGVKLDDDLKREGKLEAVQLHLDDMRKLVFKKGDGQ